jgi:hypothetical protein
VSEIIHRYPEVSWERLSRQIQWKQGQHTLCVGGTGSGKSTLAGELLPRRSHVAVCVSKGYDEIFDSKYYRDYITYHDWPPKDKDNRVLVWPSNGKTTEETREIKREVFAKMFDRILLVTGGWCISFDEVHYLSESLRLSKHIVDLEEQGRSHHISLWANTQRPAGIPLACYTNASHAFFFLTQEDYDVRRLGSIRNRHTTAKELKANIEQLRLHEFIYIDRYGVIPPCRSIVNIKRPVTSSRKAS